MIKLQSNLLLASLVLLVSFLTKMNKLMITNIALKVSKRQPLEHIWSIKLGLKQVKVIVIIVELE
jgi:hypothetical protein